MMITKAVDTISLRQNGLVYDKYQSVAPGAKSLICRWSPTHRSSESERLAFGGRRRRQAAASLQEPASRESRAC